MDAYVTPRASAALLTTMTPSKFVQSRSFWPLQHVALNPLKAQYCSPVGLRKLRDVAANAKELQGIAQLNLRTHTLLRRLQRGVDATGQENVSTEMLKKMISAIKACASTQRSIPYWMRHQHMIASLLDHDHLVHVHSCKSNNMSSWSRHCSQALACAAQSML